MNMKSRQKFRSKRLASTLTLFPLYLTIVFVVGAIAVDFGRFQFEKSKLQNAADAAATAAAMRLGNGIDDESVEEAYVYASHFANLNERHEGEVLTTDDIEFGTWDFGKREFNPLPDSKRDETGAIRVTVRRGAQNTTGISTSFMQLFGVGKVRASRTAVAVLTPSSSAMVIPLALRNVDEDPVAPSLAHIDIPSRPEDNVQFAVGEKVDLLMYGPNAPASHLALRWDSNGDNASRSSVKSVLSGQDDHVEMEVGDMVSVFDSGRGNGEFGDALVQRLGAANGSPKRRVVLPIVEEQPSTRDIHQNIVGRFRVVDFAAVQLSRRYSKNIKDPDDLSKNVNVYIIEGHIVNKRSNMGTGGGSPSGVGGRSTTIVELVD